MPGVSATTILFEAPPEAVTRCRIGMRAICDGDWIEAARQFKAAAGHSPENGQWDHEWAAKCFMFARELENIALIQTGKQH